MDCCCSVAHSRLGPTVNERNQDITSTIVLELDAPKPLQELFTSFPWQECRNDEPYELQYANPHSTDLGLLTLGLSVLWTFSVHPLARHAEWR